MSKKSDKNIYEIIAEDLHVMLKKHYNLTISEDRANGIAKHLVSLYRAKVESPLVNKKNPLFKSLKSFYSVTTIPIDEFKKHSCYYFACYLQSNYTVIIVKKSRLLNRLLSRIRK